MGCRRRWSPARAAWLEAVVRAGSRRPGPTGGFTSPRWKGAATRTDNAQRFLSTLPSVTPDAWGLVVAAVAGGFPVDARDPAGLTVLHHAAQAGALQAAQVALRHGADPNAATVEGWSPLSYAVHGGHTRVVQALVQGGADVNSFTAASFESGPTALLGLAHSEDTLRCLLSVPDLDLGVVTRAGPSRRWAGPFIHGMQPRRAFVDMVVEEVRAHVHVLQ